MGEQKKKPEKTTIIKDSLILFVITLMAGLLLGYINQLTKEPIAAYENGKKNEAYQMVFKDGKSFEEDMELSKKLESASFSGAEIKEVLVAKDDANNSIGYVLNLVAKEGYGGDITLAIGVKTDAVMTGMRVISHSETASLGEKCTEEAFQAQFNGLVGPEIQYSKTGKQEKNEFDAISGATITSKALNVAINAGLSFLEDNGCFKMENKEG